MPAPIQTRYRLETTFASEGANGMLHRLTDEEGGLRVTLAPFAGAEIAGFQVRHNGRWIELLDRAQDFTPCERWRGRAPWLWPAVGRSYAPEKLERALQTGEPPTEFEWEWEGRTYPMPLHGFAMSREWKVVGTRVGNEGAVAEYALVSDSQTRQNYPFGFVALLTYQLRDGVFHASMRVEAAKGNSSPMPFCLGNHITLHLPFTSAGQFGDARVFAPVRRVHRVTRLGLPGETAELNLREGILLSDERLHDLIVGHFPPEQATVRVADPSGMEVEISQRVSTRSGSMISHDSMYFVFYGLPEHGVFCPEPWLGLPNWLNTQRGAVQVRPQEIFEWEMILQVSPVSPLFSNP